MRERLREGIAIDREDESRLAFSDECRQLLFDDFERRAVRKRPEKLDKYHNRVLFLPDEALIWVRMERHYFRDINTDEVKRPSHSYLYIDIENGDAPEIIRHKRFIIPSLGIVELERDSDLCPPQGDRIGEIAEYGNTGYWVANLMRDCSPGQAYELVGYLYGGAKPVGPPT